MFLPWTTRIEKSNKLTVGQNDRSTKRELFTTLSAYRPHTQDQKNEPKFIFYLQLFNVKKCSLHTKKWMFLDRNKKCLCCTLSTFYCLFSACFLASLLALAAAFWHSICCWATLHVFLRWYAVEDLWLLIKEHPCFLHLYWCSLCFPWQCSHRCLSSLPT